MKKLTEYFLVAGLGLAGVVGFGKLAINNDKTAGRYYDLEWKITTKNPNVIRIDELRQYLMESKSESLYEIDKNPFEFAEKSKEYAELISDERNKKDLEACSKFRTKQFICGLIQGAYVLGTASLAVLMGALPVKDYLERRKANKEKK
jgi:hypothetical protein